MKDQGIGRGIATLAVWGGLAGIMYLLHSFNILSAAGAGWMIVGGFLTTGKIWTI